MRVTDQNTNGGESFISIDSGSFRTWNADSTAIKLTGPHGDGYWLEFNPNTFRVGDGSSNPVIHPVPFGARWEWSTVDPDIIYYLNGNQIAAYNKSTGVTKNLGGPPNGDPVAYFPVVVGQDNWVCAPAGSGPQDSYTEIFCVNPVSTGTTKFIDVLNKTINGVPQGNPNWPTAASGQTLGIHGISGGTGASWFEATFHGQSWGANGGSVFDLGTNTWSLVTNADFYWSGHVSMGNGKYANGSGSVSGQDSRGYVVRDPDNLMNSSSYQFIEQPPRPANNWCDSEHPSWLNSITNPNAPILISRFTVVSPCQFAWSGEIVAAAVGGSNTVWRFAHNHSTGSCYYGEGFAQISNDGNWALFSSYWDGQLGSDTSFGCSTRIDTFIVQLSGSRSPTITTTSLPNGTQNVPYTAALSATGGVTPYTWSITSGSLPLGLSLSPSDGTITGIPTTSGTSTFTIQVLDAASQMSAAMLNIVTTPAPDLIAPSTPTGLQLSNVTSNSMTITWTSSTDNVAVAGYQIFRNGVQIGTTSGTSYSDSGLSPSTTYAYTVAAFDTSNNVSPPSQQLFVTTADGSTIPPSIVQLSQNQISSGASTSAAFNVAATSGNTIIVYVSWSNRSAVSVTDSRGDTFVRVSPPRGWGNGYSAQVFYATNIAGGATTVTASFGTPVSFFGTLYIHEYAGINAVNPIDATASASGSSSFMNSGNITTTSANDLIFGAGVSDNSVTAAGTGFAARDLAYGNITEDQMGSTAGPYSATATHNGTQWAMQVVAFRPASVPDTTAPTIPTGLSATAVSSSQVNLSWAASTDPDNTPGQLSYRVYRNSVLISTTAAGTTSFNDTGLAASTTYTYTVSAQDPAGNASAPSSSVQITTQVPVPTISSFNASPSSITNGQRATLSWVVSNATSLSLDNGIGSVTGTSSITVSPSATAVYTLTATNGSGSATAQASVTVIPDMTQPTAPTNLTTATASSSQINLSWTASTDNVGVAGYSIYRNGAPLTTTTLTIYSDTGLAASTTYTYTVSAFDAAGNTSSPSYSATATTSSAGGPTSPYTTNFTLTENPISEGGDWLNGKTNGLDWSDVQTIPGLAFGTQSGSNGFDDSIAVLTGTWGPDQTVQATVHSVNQSLNYVEEVELHLRKTITPHSSTGYEITFRCTGNLNQGYMRIVRWNGPLGNFSLLNFSGPGANGVKDGDVVKANITGSTITVWLNGVQIGQATDSTYTSGNPGIGFYLQGASGVNSDFGLTSFNTSGGSSTVDTTPPTVPANLSGIATSSSQINLSWTASTDNVGVTGYEVFRNGNLLATTAATTFSDTGLTPNTLYSYTVAASDAAGNLSAQSAPVSVTTPAVPDVMAPSTPTGLQASNVTSSSVTITWTGSTDNVAVAGYQIFRNGVQIGTTSGTSYGDSGLSPSTTYAYTVAAFDTSNNVSPPSQQLFVTTAVGPAIPPSIVQLSQNRISSGVSTSAAFNVAATSGNTIIVYVSWSNRSAVSVTDSRGDTFVRVSPPRGWGNGYSAQVFYATNIAGGATTVTASFGTPVSLFGTLYIHEYAGINAVNPIDATASASGSSSFMNSGNITTTSANDLIFGAGVSNNTVTAAGTGFTARDLAYGNITEDQMGSTAGRYNATATQNGTQWAMQVVAFRPAGLDTTAPTTPTGLQASNVTSSSVTIKWTRSTDNIAVAGYQIFRNGVQIGTTTGTSYSDSGLSPSTTYAYTVAAFDTSNNVSPQSEQLLVTTRRVHLGLFN